MVGVHVGYLDTDMAAHVDGPKTDPAELARYLVDKGSVTVDGTSLTVVEVVDDGPDAPWFSVSLIPTTLADTTLGSKTAGDRVNLEVDVLAKYVERLLGAQKADPTTEGQHS